MSTILPIVPPRGHLVGPCKTVLVLDPDADSRTVVATVLRSRDYRVLEAANHACGIRLTRRDRPDLAIIEFEDRHRRRELAAALRNTREGQPPVLLVVSAWALPDEREAVLADGFDGFYTKPIRLEHLLGEVRRWLTLPGRVPR